MYVCEGSFALANSADEQRRSERENPPQPLTKAERATLERGLADLRAGRLIDMQEIEREFGVDR